MKVSDDQEYQAESLSTHLIELLKKDAQRMQILQVVRDLDLSDCYVAAGFVRNLVWDYLCDTTTPLNDIDVVFFDASSSVAKSLTQHLNTEYPEYKWEVKNQAFMHARNGDLPYKSTVDAMSFWPEKETAVGVVLTGLGTIEVVSAFGLQSLFAGKITHNSKRDRATFSHRIESKNWLATWPKLEVVL